MAWPKRRRLLRLPFLVGLALLAALAAAAVLGARPRLLDAGAVGLSLLAAWVALAPAFLAWGLWRLARKGWARGLVLVAAGALSAGAAFADVLRDAATG